MKVSIRYRLMKLPALQRADVSMSQNRLQVFTLGRDSRTPLLGESKRWKLISEGANFTACTDGHYPECIGIA